MKQLKRFLFENTSTRQTVAKNSFWIGTGTIAARLIRAGLLVVVARLLGAAEFGVFSYALSFAAFFTVFVDLGINGVVVRESSRDVALQGTYVSTGTVIKLAMYGIVAVLMLFVGPFIVKDPVVRTLMPILVFLVGFDSFKDFGASLSRAWEKMQIEAGVHIFTNIAITILSIGALFVFHTSRAILIGYTIGVFAGMLFAFYPLWGRIREYARTFSARLILPILASSWLFGMLNLMAVVQLNTDVIMIGWFRSIVEVGYYSAAQKIILMVYLIPGIVGVALFPKMVKSGGDRAYLGMIVDTVLEMMHACAVPLTVGAVLLGSGIMTLVYGPAYAPGISSFIIMSMTFIPVFISGILSYVIFAIHEERKFLPYIIMGIFGNFVFNLLFIPPWGIAGSSLSTLLNQIIITTYLYFAVRKSVPIHFARHSGNSFAGAALMGAVIFGLARLHVPTLIVIAIGAAVYIGFLYIRKDAVIREAKKIFFHA